MATTGSEKMKSSNEADSLNKINRASSSSDSFGGAATEKLSSLATVVRDNAGDYLNKAGGVATDVASKAKEYGDMAVDETTSFIRKYPTQSLLAGFGIGLLIGIGLARR